MKTIKLKCRCGAEAEFPEHAAMAGEWLDRHDKCYAGFHIRANRPPIRWEEPDKNPPPALTRADLILLLEIGLHHSGQYFIKKDMEDSWQNALEYLTAGPTTDPAPEKRDDTRPPPDPDLSDPRRRG